MLEITKKQLSLITGLGENVAALIAPALNDAMRKYDISSARRAAHFIAQIAHESGRFCYVSEIWGPTAAQKKYEGRSDLGNVVVGDGYKFRGRGYIQITGRANYKSCGDALGIDLITNPELLTTRQGAAMSAAWFWHSRGLNALADADNVRQITRKINGGFNGMADREALLKKAKKALEINQ